MKQKKTFRFYFKKTKRDKISKLKDKTLQSYVPAGQDVSCLSESTKNLVNIMQCRTNEHDKNMFKSQSCAT